MSDVGRGRPTRRAEGDPFVREDRAFIDAVQGKPNQIRAPYAEALKSFQLTLAANQSAHEGRELDFLAHRISDGGNIQALLKRSHVLLFVFCTLDSICPFDFFKTNILF